MGRQASGPVGIRGASGQSPPDRLEDLGVEYRENPSAAGAADIEEDDGFWRSWNGFWRS